MENKRLTTLWLWMRIQTIIYIVEGMSTTNYNRVINGLQEGDEEN